MSHANDLRVLVAGDEALSRSVVDALSATIPAARATHIEVSALAGGGRHLPRARCAVVGPRFGDLALLDALRALRAASFDGGFVVVASDAPTTEVEAAARQLGVNEFVSPDAIVSLLPAAIVRAASAPEDSEAMRQLREMQRLIAAGEIALGLQHSLNNPLAALLAEAQLMEMEPLAEEHLQAVRRMVELCRRLAAIVRRLDVVATSKS